MLLTRTRSSKNETLIKLKWITLKLSWKVLAENPCGKWIFKWPICISVALSTVFTDQYEMRWRSHFQFCPWWLDLEFGNFARFTPETIRVFKFLPAKPEFVCLGWECVVLLKVKIKGFFIIQPNSVFLISRNKSGF